MTTKPEELPFLCIVQSQQNVRILANPTDKVLHVDIEIEAGYFLWLFILFQQHLEAGKNKLLHKLHVHGSCHKMQ